MHYLGVDVGTSGCKAVAFNEDGQQAALAYREYNILAPHEGWAELDSSRVMRSCFEVIREAAAALPPNSIRALGISSQGEAFTPVDAEGRCLGNGMTSSDQRAAAYAESFPAAFGADKLYRITGHTPHPLFTIFKLLWLRDNQPEEWGAAHQFLCFEDLLQRHLGLEPALGWSLAGRTMLFDVRRHEWDPEILDAVGLSPDKLARPLPSGTLVGNPAPEIARDLGLPEDVAVVTGGHDQPCGALGAGATSPGLGMYATGTVECIAPVLAGAVLTDELQAANLATYDHAVPGQYVTVAYSLTGGNILKWFRDEFGAPEVAAAEASGENPYTLLLRAAGDQPANALVLPYFTPTGTPYFDTNVAGAALGLRMSTTRGEFIRALLEGVAFEMRLNLDILARAGCEMSELRVIGGGAKSDAWNQLKADVIGTPLTTLDVTEAGCLGVAILARAHDAGQTPAEVAHQWVRPQTQVAPRPEHAEWYAERFAAYRELYPALRGLRLHQA